MMDLKVVPFKAKTDEWDQQVQADTIAMLESWLQEAKEGRYSGVAICGVTQDGMAVTNMADHSDHPALIGAATLLQFRLLRSVEPVTVG